MKLPKFVYQWIERLKENNKLPRRRIDELPEPETWMRTVARSILTLVISAFMMTAAGGLITYPGGIPTLLAEILVWANRSAGGVMTFEQLLAGLAAALIFLINFTILMAYVPNEPVYPSDVRDMLLDFDDIVAERLGAVQYTLDSEVVDRIGKL